MRTAATDPRRFAPIPILLLIAALLGFAAPPAAADGLTPWDVARLRSVGDVEASPDGQHVAYTLSVQRNPFEEENGSAWRELHVLGPDGTSRPYVSGQVAIGDVSWTPDGRAITFLDERGDDDGDALYALPLAGGEARRVLSHDGGIDSYAWAPDGRHVAFLADEQEPEEAEEMEEKGFDAEIFEEEWRPTRVWIAEIGDDGMAKGEPRVLELDGSASELSWSPAGDRIAVALAPTSLIDDHYMSRRVHVVDPTNGTVTGSVANPGKLGNVAWSPDGRHLAMVSAADLNDPSEGRLMVVPASGGTPRDLLPGYEGHVDQVAWRDASTILYRASERVSTVVATLDVDGGEPNVLLPAGDVAWSDMAQLAGGGLVLVGESARHPDEVYRVTDGGTPERLTDSNPWLAERDLAAQEVVTFEARDGLEIDGILIRPLGEVEGNRYPLILSVHGGPEAHHSNGWMTSYSGPGQVAAARGFAVFYTNYRGSTGRGVAFSKLSQADPAGLEFQDLVDAVDHLVSTGLVDEDKVGITGGSYGGYATAWGSTYYSERFAAGVMFVGISDKVAKLGMSDIPKEEYEVHAREWPWEDWQKMLETSPIYHVEKSKTPLLIMGGTADTRVNPAHSLILYRYLKLLGNAPVRYVRYPGEPHGNRKAAARLDYNLRMLRWFEHYLQGPGGEAPAADLDYGEPVAGGMGSDMEADEEAEGEEMEEDRVEDDGR